MTNTDLLATLEQWADDLFATHTGRDGLTCGFRFANGYGARVTRTDDGDWFLDLILADGTTVPFLPHRLRLRGAQVATGLAMISTAPATTRTLRESIAILESIPALAPIAPYARYLRRVRWFPAFAELVFQFGDYVATVRWVFEDARLGVPFDVFTLAVYRDGTDPSVPFVEEVSVLTVTQVAQALNGMERGLAASLHGDAL
jgi:hypothetical protein